jgi:nucleoredoxin
MPWLTLAFDERQKSQDIGEKFGISGIPALVLLDGDSGEVINTNARSQIQREDPEGKNFPWKS